MSSSGTQTTYWADWERLPRSLRDQYPTPTKEAQPRSIRISQITFELPIINFQNMYYWAETDGTIRDVSNYIADQALANGITITYDPDYGDKGKKAKELIEDFNYDVNMRQLAWNTIKWGYLTGNVFEYDKTNFIEERKLEILPIDSILSIKRSQDPVTGYTKLDNLRQTFEYQGRTVEAERLLHYRYGLDNTSGFGRGIMQSLLASRQVTLSDPKQRSVKTTIQVPPLMYVMSMLIYDINQAYHSYAEPKRLISLEGAPPAGASPLTPGTIPGSELTAFRTNWNLPGDVAVNYKASIMNATVSPGTRWTNEITFLENRFMETFGMPYNKLFTTPGFTEASARIAKEIADRRVYSLQQWWADYTEYNIYKPLLEHNGLSAAKAKIRIKFGSLDRTPTKIGEILQAAGIGNSNQQARAILKPSEARQLLRDMAGWGVMDPKIDAEMDAAQEKWEAQQVELQKQAAQKPSPTQQNGSPKATKVTDTATGKEYTIE